MGIATIPQLVFPCHLSENEAPHIKINYSSGEPDEVSLGVIGGADYYADGQTGDLLDHVETALNADTSDGTWSLSWSSGLGGSLHGRWFWSRTGGSRTVTSIEFLTSSFTAQHVGLDVSAAVPKAIAVTSSGAAMDTLSGAYRVRWLFTPDDIMTKEESKPRYASKAPQNDTGSGFWIVGGKRLDHVQFIPRMWAVFANAQYAKDSDHVTLATGFTINDPNASWSEWFDHFKDDHGNKRFVVQRWAKDRTVPSTFMTVRLNDEATLQAPHSVFEIVETHPLQFEMSLSLNEVIS